MDEIKTKYTLISESIGPDHTQTRTKIKTVFKCDTLEDFIFNNRQFLLDNGFTIDQVDYFIRPNWIDSDYER